jgi:IPTL-CTERM motif
MKYVGPWTCGGAVLLGAIFCVQSAVAQSADGVDGGQRFSSQSEIVSESLAIVPAGFGNDVPRHEFADRDQPQAVGGACTQSTEQIDTLGGANPTGCPCFASGERIMTIFDVPPGGPATIERIQVFWGSVLGGNPPSLEQALIVYDMNQVGAVDSNSFVPLFTLPGPQLTDGVINEFNVSAFNIMLPTSRFGVALEFLNQNAGDVFASTVAHDGNGINNLGGIDRNWLLAIPGGWLESGSQGVTGDWIIRAVVEVCAPPVPTVSQWGVMILALLVATSGTIVFTRRRTGATI